MNIRPEAFVLRLEGVSLGELMHALRESNIVLCDTLLPGVKVLKANPAGVRSNVVALQPRLSP